jgi:hypothetical protein
MILEHVYLYIGTSGRRLVLNYLLDHVREKIEHVPRIPNDLKTEIINNELYYYINMDNVLRDRDTENQYIDQKYPDRRFYRPYFIKHKCQFSRGFFLELICNWIGADLHKIYWYSNNSDTKNTTIIDRYDILNRNTSSVYSQRLSTNNRFFCDRKLLTKLIDTGILILEVFDGDHYIIVFRHGPDYIGISTLDDGLDLLGIEG